MLFDLLFERDLHKMSDLIVKVLRRLTDVIDINLNQIHTMLALMMGEELNPEYFSTVIKIP
jgi:hypothetical protein